MSVILTSESLSADLLDDDINDNADSTDNSSMLDMATDILIIGAGLAGLSTALALPKSLNITILSKAALETCSSHYAQGGIAASLDKEDSISDHIADTLIAGAGLCAPDNTASILSKGQQAVQWLCAQGVPFTQIPLTDRSQNHSIITPAALTTADLHLTKEGGHGCRRVAHADDATGRYVMQALITKAQLATNITILPYHEALSLLTAPSAITATDSIFKEKWTNGFDGSSCQGAVVFDHAKNRQLTIHSRAVVLASGGLGQLFARASAPNVCVGDGVMMAWQAGCRLANLEFIQFHPTGLALGDSSFLVSEALRGEGGRLYCPLTGIRFMLEVDPRAELAPRDIVARAIAKQIDNNGLGFVHLDVSHLPAEFLQQHFPQIYQTLLELGINITTDPIPVAPTAHYSCGGVITCANGLTDLAGLYAAGEVAYTGLHGANRLASNSLLECVVVGRNIAAHLPRYLTALSEIATSHTVASSTSRIWLPPYLPNAQVIALPSFDLISPYKNTIANNSSLYINKERPIKDITTKLKALMSSHMGITRSAKPLQQALRQIQQWQYDIQSLYSTPSNSVRRLNNIGSSATLSELSRFQLARQLQLATLIIESAYQRCESRGGHYRQDYPDLALQPQISVIEPISVDVDSYNDLPYEVVASMTPHNRLKTVANV